MKLDLEAIEAQAKECTDFHAREDIALLVAEVHRMGEDIEKQNDAHYEQVLKSLEQQRQIRELKEQLAGYEQHERQLSNENDELTTACDAAIKALQLLVRVRQLVGPKEIGAPLYAEIDALIESPKTVCLGTPEMFGMKRAEPQRCLCGRIAPQIVGSDDEPESVRQLCDVCVEVWFAELSAPVVANCPNCRCVIAVQP